MKLIEVALAMGTIRKQMTTFYFSLAGFIMNFFLFNEQMTFSKLVFFRAYSNISFGVVFVSIPIMSKS